MKAQKKTKKQPVPAVPEHTIENARIVKLDIGIEPDNSSYVRVFLENNQTLKRSNTKPFFCHYFSIHSLDNAKSSAERLGSMIFQLANVVDYCGNVNDYVGKIVRAKLYSEDGHIFAIGSALSDYWVENYKPSPATRYPFHSGVYPDRVVKK